MKEQRVLLLTCYVMAVIYAISGCESYREKETIGHTISEPVSTTKSPESGQAKKPSESQDRSDSEVGSETAYQTARILTMKDIWALRRQGACEKLIQAADNFIQAGRADENTKGTCLYLKGDCQRQMGRFKEAEITFQIVLSDYGDAVWPDPNVVPSRYVPVKPQVDVGLRLLAERDRSRFPEDSDSYTALAWKYLRRERFDTAIFFAWECIRRFGTEAVRQQKLHVIKYKERLPKLSPDPEKNEGILQKYWALYDVGTCCFIVGQAYEYKADRVEKRGNFQEARKLYDKAVKQYGMIVTDYPAAQCFDPSGPWFWSVKEGALERINRITVSKLKRAEHK